MIHRLFVRTKINDAIGDDDIGILVGQVRIFQLRHLEFDIPILQAGRRHRLSGSFDHVGRHVNSHHFPLWPYFMRRQNDVDTAAAAKIHHHLAGLQLCVARGVAAASCQVECGFRHQGQFCLPVEPLIHGIARTGPLPAGSTGLFTPALGRKLVIAALNRFSDLVGIHRLNPPWALPGQTARDNSFTSSNRCSASQDSVGRASVPAWKQAQWLHIRVIHTRNYNDPALI